MMQLRVRLLYWLAVFIVVILGLSSRVYSESLPEFIALHFGDALWASMIYFAVRSLFVKRNFYWAVGISLLFCCGIEFSQLYQADWINRIRATYLGALILGKGFLSVDLLRYSIGIVVSLWIDKYYYIRCITKSS
jgi:hypothetical protein